MGGNETRDGVAAERTCPFCDRIASGEVVRETENAAAFADAYPVSEGHTLVVPRSHEADFFKLDATVQQEIMQLVNDIQRDLEEKKGPDGFNLGVNIGGAAGQTVGHAHVHVIPRYKGDVTDPRGGVRWVIPGKAKYWGDGGPDCS